MSNEKNMNFEEAIARLEVIVRSLENGDAPLDSSLALFEEGVALVRVCNKKLENAESRIKILLYKDGEMVEENFTGGRKTE